MNKTIVTSLMSVVLSVAANAVHADTDWPTRTVTVVIPASPGGDTDFNARTMAQYFERITGRSMVITNMPGGGGTIATSHVRNSDPDGYTMVFGHTGNMIITEVSGLADYGIDDFAICCIPAIDKGAVFVVGGRSGIENLDQLIERSREQPGSATFGTELGGYSHLQGLIFMREADIEMRVVDTGSAAEKVVALLGGRIDVAGISFGVVADYVAAGNMAVLGQPNRERNPLLGDIPTFVEQGIEYVMDNPYIIGFPAGTDPEIVERMSSIMREITEIPEYAADLERGFRQPVSFYGTDEAIEHLRGIRENYMQYQDLLRGAR